MAKFIYDENQKKAVNLDNVDTIRRDHNGSEFTIFFQKQLSVKDNTQAATLDKWVFKSESDRDDMFYKVMKAGDGERLDSYIPVVA